MNLQKIIIFLCISFFILSCDNETIEFPEEEMDCRWADCPDPDTVPNDYLEYLAWEKEIDTDPNNYRDRIIEYYDEHLYVLKEGFINQVFKISPSWGFEDWEWTFDQSTPDGIGYHQNSNKIILHTHKRVIALDNLSGIPNQIENYPSGSSQEQFVGKNYLYRTNWSFSNRLSIFKSPLESLDNSDLLFHINYADYSSSRFVVSAINEWENPTTSETHVLIAAVGISPTNNVLFNYNVDQDSMYWIKTNVLQSSTVRGNLEVDEIKIIGNDIILYDVRSFTSINLFTGEQNWFSVIPEDNTNPNNLMFLEEEKVLIYNTAEFQVDNPKLYKFDLTNGEVLEEQSIEGDHFVVFTPVNDKYISYTPDYSNTSKNILRVINAETFNVEKEIELPFLPINQIYVLENKDRLLLQSKGHLYGFNLSSLIE